MERPESHRVSFEEMGGDRCRSCYYSLRVCPTSGCVVASKLINYPQSVWVRRAHPFLWMGTCPSSSCCGVRHQLKHSGMRRYDTLRIDTKSSAKRFVSARRSKASKLEIESASAHKYILAGNAHNVNQTMRTTVSVLSTHMCVRFGHEFCSLGTNTRVGRPLLRRSALIWRICQWHHRKRAIHLSNPRRA